MKRLFLFSTLLLPFLFSCNSNSPATATFRVHLTDAPAAYNAVFIDIVKVEAHTSANGWVTLNSNPGIYNLLNFTNGVDTLIASADLPVGLVSQIRLVLGNSNSVVENSQTYPLATPSAQQSGLKLNVHYQLEAGIVYDIWLDFDANKSVVKQGNGNYILKPVIRCFTYAQTGAIKGVVSPNNITQYVSAINGTDTLGTMPDASGAFLIPGVPAGSWDVTFTPSFSQSSYTVNGVNVTIGNVTDMGTIVLP